MEQSSDEKRVTYNHIKDQLGDLMYKIVQQKFEEPDQGETVIRAKFADLHDEITQSLAGLAESI